MKKEPRKEDQEDQKDQEAVVLLEDLVPRKDVKGGSRKILFGQRRDFLTDDDPGEKKKL